MSDQVPTEALDPITWSLEMTFYTPTEADQKKIDNNFTYHPPKTDQGDRYVKLRDAAKAFAELAVTLCPPSRELSLGITNLEECVHWLNASIARNE